MESQPAVHVFHPCPALQNFVSCYTIAYMTGNQTWVRRQPAYPQQYLVFYPYEPQLHSNDGTHFQHLAKELLVVPFTKNRFIYSLAHCS